MAGNPRVFEVGSVQGIDGIPVLAGVDYGAVRVRGDGLLNRDQQETFAQLLVRASWLAGRNEDQDATP